MKLLTLKTARYILHPAMVYASQPQFANRFQSFKRAYYRIDTMIYKSTQKTKVRAMHHLIYKTSMLCLVVGLHVWANWLVHRVPLAVRFDLA